MVIAELRLFELALHAPPAGERPLGHDDRLALGVVDRMFREERPDHVHEVPVPQWVDRAGGHLGDGRLRGHRAGGRVDDRRDHEVDGDHVDRPLGDARELLQQPAGVGDDHGLGHAEAADPARARLVDRGLDDRRPDDRHREVTAVLQQGPLAEGLGVRVRVRPPERGGAGPSGLHHLLLHPGAATLLALGRQGRCAGGAELGPGLLAEAGEGIGPAAVGLGVGAGASGARHLGPPVDVDEEGAVVHRLFGGRTAPVAGDVAGGHRHEVGRDRRGPGGWPRSGSGRAGSPPLPRRAASRTTPWPRSGSRCRTWPARRDPRRRGRARPCRRRRRSGSPARPPARRSRPCRAPRASGRRRRCRRPRAWPAARRWRDGQVG